MAPGIGYNSDGKIRDDINRLCGLEGDQAAVRKEFRDGGLFLS
jgi:hypothetical protein